MLKVRRCFARKIVSENEQLIGENYFRVDKIISIRAENYFLPFAAYDIRVEIILQCDSNPNGEQLVIFYDSVSNLTTLKEQLKQVAENQHFQGLITTKITMPADCPPPALNGWLPRIFS